MEAVPGCSKEVVKVHIPKKAPLSYKEKKIILNVYHALEKDYPMVLKSGSTGLVNMTSRYTGVSESTVYKILREEKMKGMFTNLKRSLEGKK